MRAAMVSMLMVVLAGCSQERVPAEVREEDKALQKAIQAPLDKTHAVEDQVLKAQQEQQRKIDEQGG